MAVRLVILASGRGSNFSAIAEAIRQKKIPGAEIVGLVSNNPEAPALLLAREKGIPTTIIDAKSFGRGKLFDRASYESALIEVVHRLSPDLICLAGYMLLLGESFLKHWPNQIVNIHPSLLPSFRGLRAQKQALDYGVQWTGCTVHWVNEELDGGPIIAQEILEVLPQDDEDSLSTRLLEVEHRTYIKALGMLCSQAYQIDGRRMRWNP